MTSTSSQKLLAVVQPDFTPTTWEAFRRFGVDGVPAGRVAEELGLSENAVILAKISGSQAVTGGSRRPLGVNFDFRDRFDAEPAFPLQRPSLDPFPETGR